MSATIRLTRRGFEKWLRSLPPETVVYEAEAMPTVGCPLARYLRAQGDRNPEVRSDEYQLGLAGVTRPLQPWARRFAARADAAEDDEITAARALALLAEVSP
jgi:hypothetical protein